MTSELGRLLSIASFPVSPIFSTHARKEGEPTLIVSEGSVIDISLGEPCFIDQRRLIGLKSTLSTEHCTPFCQRLSRDFRSQALA